MKSTPTKRVVMAIGDGRLEHERVDRFCGLIAEQLRTLIPRRGMADVTVRVELGQVLKPAPPARRKAMAKLIR